MQGRLSRQVKHMPIQTQISITKEADNKYHRLDVVANDRPGLLAMLARTFLMHDIELHNAKINTLGNRAEDSFLISGLKGEQLDAAHIELLLEKLNEI